MKDEGCVLVHPEVVDVVLRNELVFEIDAENVDIGLNDPTFWTLLTVSAILVVPAVTSMMTLGGTMVHPVQLADDRPN